MEHQMINITPAYDAKGNPNFVDTKGNLIEGVYSGLDNKAYHALPALSSSGLKTFSTSPAHYYRTYLSDVERKRTLAQERTFETGDLAHKLILEPDGFYDEYAKELNPLDYPKALKTINDLVGKCCELGLKKTGKKADLIARLTDEDVNLKFYIWDCIKQEHLNSNVGKYLVDPIVWEDAHRCLETTRKHPLANELLTDGYAELSVIALCQNTGLWLKTRPDWLRLDKVVADYKTTRDASYKAFGRQAKELGYGLQQSFYTYVLSLVGVYITGFHFVANEYIKADITECYTLDEEWVISSKEEMAALLFEFDECKSKNNWYGYDAAHSLKVIREPWYSKPRTPASLKQDLKM